MSKQYIIMYVNAGRESYYAGPSKAYGLSWIHDQHSGKKVTVFNNPKDAEKILWEMRSGIVPAGNFNIYEYQPEQVIPAKIGNLVNTEKENVLNGLHFVEVTLHSHSPYCCELIKKAMNYIKENT
jgi:hypothetical protein